MGVFEGKTAIVTGAASGIGKALVQELAHQQAKVIATDINWEMLADTVGKINQGGNQVYSEPLDVTDYDAFKRVIDDTVSREGRLDYVFNNAGVAAAGDLRDMTLEHWQKVLNVNIDGVMHGSLLAYQQMAKQGFGHIVNLASVEGLIPFPLTVSYVTSKFAVVGLSQGMWVEGAGLGVKVSMVCPGKVSTPIFDTSPVVNTDREEVRKAVWIWDHFAVTPEQCAHKILKGVARNKPIILVTLPAYIMWWMARVSPTFFMNFVRKDFGKWRDKARIVK
jgi:short-subunit dehydrogenase